MDVFSLLIGLGATVGLIWVAYVSPENRHRNVDVGIAALFGALVGGRAAYVVVNWGYYQGHLVEIPEVWKGGISGVGALAGAVLTVTLLSVYIQPAAGELADALLPLVTTMTIAAWMGCWFDGCAYGAPVDAWWGLPARDELGIQLPRIPVQLIGALLTIALFWSIERISNRRNPGQAKSGTARCCIGDLWTIIPAR
jgi:prolipoprotein diacylglyceryltransferase